MGNVIKYTSENFANIVHYYLKLAKYDKRNLTYKELCSILFATQSYVICTYNKSILPIRESFLLDASTITLTQKLKRCLFDALASNLEDYSLEDTEVKRACDIYWSKFREMPNEEINSHVHHSYVVYLLGKHQRGVKAIDNLAFKAGYLKLLKEIGRMFEINRTLRLMSDEPY